MFKEFDTLAAWKPIQPKSKKDWVFEINKKASDHVAENIKKVFEAKKELFDYNRDEFDLDPILENVINAAKFLRKKKLPFFSLTGMKKNNLLNRISISKNNLWVNNMSYNQIEIVHHLVLLLIIDLLIGKSVYKA